MALRSRCSTAAKYSNHSDRHQPSTILAALLTSPAGLSDRPARSSNRGAHSKGDYNSADLAPQRSANVDMRRVISLHPAAKIPKNQAHERQILEE